MIKSLLARLRAELEAPRERRPFGSGWIAGTLGIVAGIAALLMVVALRHPSLFTMPELAVIRDSALFRPAIYVVLASAFGLAALSLALRRDKVLGIAAMTVTLLASLIGSLPSTDALVHVEGVFFGLDFFVINVLFLGFLFLPLERLIPHDADQYVLRDEWREDLFYYLVSSLFVQVLTYLTLAPSQFILAHGEWSHIRAAVGLPWLVQLLLIMFLSDLAQYWMHRMFHRVPALWRFHAVHHSAKSLDWVAGARMHFLEIIVLRATTATPMFVLGFHESVLQVYILIVYVLSSFVHANIGTNFGFLEKIMVVPRFHHWHHGIDKEAIDVNFAIHFPILDRLFGTYHMPKDQWPSGYGIAGHPVPRGYWQQFLYPFRRTS